MPEQKSHRRGSGRRRRRERLTARGLLAAMRGRPTLTLFVAGVLAVLLVFALTVGLADATPVETSWSDR